MRWLDSIPPSKFKNWNPYDPNKKSKKNKEWVNDYRFDLLAKIFGDVLVESVSAALSMNMQLPANVPSFASNRDIPALGKSGLILSANSKNPGPNAFSCKRYIRLSPFPYHPDSCQLFIEAYMPSTTHDGNDRDSSDSHFKKFGFPVGDNHIGITIGFSAILRTEKFDYNDPDENEKWTMCASVLEGLREDFDQVYEEFDDVTDCVNKASKAMGSEAPPLMDERVSRIRVRLHDQSLDAEDWNECGLAESMSKLATFFARDLSEIGLR
tara:strand:- start:161 stop:964 length:804 start_codon:yes stop_codon:yes gene_type:complete